jgi:hypothetical protein
MNEGERKSLNKGYPLMYSAIHIRRRIGAPEFFPSLLGAINQYLSARLRPWLDWMSYGAMLYPLAEH